MKPFLISILKCNQCDSEDFLNVFIEKAEEIEIEEDLDFFKEHINKFYIEKGKLLKNIIKKLEVTSLNENDCDLLINGDNSKLKEFAKVLLGYEIFEGYLECSNCQVKFMITDRIPDFVDFVSSNKEQ
ncbi:hypothetical protein CWI37_2184p0010 [Hamiltosporidium tvaerminnensis]|uniref:Trm112p-like protein n=1 Tax=Hamiltosporidium tvaerminnensis TaxID=1176355 RepID=A0A4Q9KS70_9MICR|nr:hypothetical protein LUQ84_000098 [Hamiltosporidium tvaerminnensis]TBT97577.1 hypothetical protein CWI37_2184p0010 [Hamiltosporidium tvaerminnensis]